MKARRLAWSLGLLVPGLVVHCGGKPFTLDAEHAGTGGQTTGVGATAGDPETGGGGTSSTDGGIGSGTGLSGSTSVIPPTGGGGGGGASSSGAASGAGGVPVTPTQRDLGAPCDAAGQCRSGFCANSICCQSACDGPCQVCLGDGTCDYKDSDPVKCAPFECTNATDCISMEKPAQSCVDSLCNGAKCKVCATADHCARKNAPAGTVCARTSPPSQDICDGNGNCSHQVSCDKSNGRNLICENGQSCCGAATAAEPNDAGAPIHGPTCSDTGEGCTGYVMGCDGREDCPPNSVCCYNANLDGPSTGTVKPWLTSCQEKCDFKRADESDLLSSIQQTPLCTIKATDTASGDCPPPSPEEKARFPDRPTLQFFCLNLYGAGTPHVCKLM